MSNEIVFFDLPSKPPCKSWSLNPWKTRLALNFKGLPYKTEWVEYPDIKPRFQDHLPPVDLYTIPAVIMPDGTWLMDSYTIADALEEKYPEPSLRLDSPYIQRLRENLFEMMPPLTAIYKPKVCKLVLNEPSAAYFRRTREVDEGMTLEQLEEQKGGAKAWEAAKSGFHKITDLLKENSEGPFFEGKTVGFVDFIWAGTLIFFSRFGDDVFADLLEASGDGDVHLKFLEAVKPWSERDDH
ncbi:putative glutathione S-transferase [Hypoxylon rubiginosum]|uniref:Glutathione S-transferase n=1 Tax=Hypoxylon rubiginosum TaxID=110542 RepID=A0ACB9ZD20_9PEZI|nr:putative glutathione S-transferase [Hypoxylon rubiginosum]